MTLSLNRQLTEIRSQEALEKERTRRDYERLRLELEEVAKHEKEAKDKAAKVRILSALSLAVLNITWLFRLSVTFRQFSLTSKNKLGSSS